MHIKPISRDVDRNDCSAPEVRGDGPVSQAAYKSYYKAFAPPLSRWIRTRYATSHVAGQGLRAQLEIKQRPVATPHGGKVVEAFVRFHEDKLDELLAIANRVGMVQDHTRIFGHTFSVSPVLL
jgi:hypothetical protein